MVNILQLAVVLLVGAGGLTVIAFFVSNRNVNNLRNQGLWPQPGQTATIEDVKRLIASGYKIEAIKMYREMYRTSLKDSKDAVEALNS